MKNLKPIFVILIIISFLGCANALASERVVNLVVSYKTVHFAGKYKKAIAVNNQIPAPTLHFKEGDKITINVCNQLDKETAIHWHGVLVPWQMDGVLGINQRGIPPGGVFHYQFTLKQAGTYWYHAHAGLQEQQGLYGAFLIEPSEQPPYKYSKDYVVVLSDWSNTNPDQILANLKKEGDYYSPNFPLQPSLAKFMHDYCKASKEERQALIADYKMMQQMRMSIYDISDVAYDAFLLNGHSNCNPWIAPVKIGDVVRLRFIGAGGSTIFHVKIPGTSMQIVHVEGNDVMPFSVNDFTIAPGETYDVLINIQKNAPYIIYAESRDTVGAAYGALITSKNQIVNFQTVAKFSEPLPVTREMMAMMMGNMTQGSLPANNKAMESKKSQPHSMSGMSHAMTNMKMGTKNSEHMNMSDGMKMDHGMNMSDGMKMDHGTNTNGSMKMDHGTNTSGSMKMDHGMNKSDSMNMGHGMNMSGGMKMNHGMNMSGSMNMDHGMNMSGSMKMNHGMNMDHGMSMPTEPSIMGDTIAPPNASFETSVGTKYDNVIAAVKTNNPQKPVAGIIRMELFGYMDRFIWFINGEPEHMAHPIILQPGKRYRIIFTNTSMMHHPMHIHGHWFILRKGNADYDPLLHTIDVPPGATITVDVDTDASGQWMFHCHLLYHMLAGMARTIQYSTLIEITKCQAKPQNIIKQTAYHNRPIIRVDEARPIDVSLVKHPMPHPENLWFATMLDIGVNPVTNVGKLNYKGLYGKDFNKLQLFTNDAEIKQGKIENADIDIFYWHLLDQFWAVKGGLNYFYRPAQTPYWQGGIGIEGLMPYFIDTDVRGYYYSGSAKLDIELSRDSQITNNFFIRTGIRSILATKTITRRGIGSGLNQMRYILRPYYRLMPGLNAFAELEYEEDYGAFKRIQRIAGDATSETALTFGLTVLF